MTFRIKRKRKSKSKKFYKRNKTKRKRSTRKKYLNRRSKQGTRKPKAWGGMIGGNRKNKQLLGLAINLQNAMFEFNKKNFINNKNFLKIKTNPEIQVSEFIREQDINIVGPDFDPVRGDIEQYILNWNHKNDNIDVPPWYKFIGKLCEVPLGFFANNKSPRGNLYDVKQTLANFNPIFPRDPENKNIIEIKFNILGHANDEKQAVNDKNEIILPGKYKFVLTTKNKNIRFFADTSNRNPYYYLPAVMLYFYNLGKISFDELKGYLENEIPHSFLFNPRNRRELIMGAGDFTVDANRYIVELTGYSGHTKPLPSNIEFSASEFNKLGYPLVYARTETVQLQTYNTERSDINGRLIGTYLNVKYRRQPEEGEDNADAMPIANEEETNIQLP